MSRTAASLTAAKLHTEERAAERWVGAPPDPGEALRAFAHRLRTRRLDDARGLSAAIDAQEILERATALSR